MRVYGLRIADTGIEFSLRDERDKALLTFTKGSSVEIRTYAGPRYADGKGAFSTYERDTNQPVNNCEACSQPHAAECCPKRTTPAKDYSGKFTGKEVEIFICDGCHAARLQDFKVFQAQKVLQEAKVTE
jgi:hypothetical protein